MSRRKLPSRRHSEVFNFEHRGLKYQAGVSHFEDGKLAEVFLQSGKSGVAIDAVARDGGVVLSLALQYGCPLSDLRAAITRDEDGIAAGPIGALLDLVEDIRIAPVMPSAFEEAAAAE